MVRSVGWYTSYSQYHGRSTWCWCTMPPPITRRQRGLRMGILWFPSKNKTDDLKSSHQASPVKIPKIDTLGTNSGTHRASWGRGTWCWDCRRTKQFKQRASSEPCAAAGPWPRSVWAGSSSVQTGTCARSCLALRNHLLASVSSRVIWTCCSAGQRVGVEYTQYH